MTNDDARRVLEDIGAELTELGALFLPKGWEITTYTPDQLEAIAKWMRDPKGVMPAASQPEP